MKHLQMVFLRHGHCEGGDIVRGRTDVALSFEGEAQMNQAFNSLPKLPDCVFTSPLQRCQLWSDDIAKQHALPISTLADLQEIDFGDWDGELWQHLYQQYGGQVSAYYANPWDADNTPNNAEPLALFTQRVEQVLLFILQQLSLTKRCEDQSHASSLVVTHGGVIRTVIGLILDMRKSATLYSQLAIPYGALVSVDAYIDDKPLVSLDDISFRLNWPTLSAKIGQH
ncbi:histidine phosphatase family protein [Shewanella aestuarii]|uniref:Histidine phosphatase family protein n=1 Tax=Shewanella aestuarii TaxID=1028752 RepID=A0A6G9QLR9_9GAMM|nr:histidine phosphatase family protein [Shewanella aestuarii]QIR15422.1 hypothetical protein HBH39_13705 [Shewanella aestuarii]